jgi:hypothetical protein
MYSTNIPRLATVIYLDGQEKMKDPNSAAVEYAWAVG